MTNYDKLQEKIEDLGEIEVEDIDCEYITIKSYNLNMGEDLINDIMEEIEFECEAGDKLVYVNEISYYDDEKEPFLLIGFKCNIGEEYKYEEELLEESKIEYDEDYYRDR